MRITDLLKSSGLALQTTASSKEEVFDLLMDLHVKNGNISDKEAFKAGIMAREEQGPTAIADGICIPHTKSQAVKQPGLVAATVPSGVDCNALDGNPSTLFFMIAAPATGSDVHLEVLSRLSTILMDGEFRDALLGTTDPTEFLSIIDQKEKEKFDEEPAAPAASTNTSATGYRVLAVTACPTGIAHTYMAAEALENKGQELGIPVKAETNGSGGAKNILTKEEIEACDGIIIAADKNVEMARFDGKPVIKTKVADGIHKPQELIEKIVNKEAPIYHHAGGSDTSESMEDDESLGRQVYKHLMNGVSHMLPFVIGGGILIALAFLLDDYSIDPSNFGMNTPVAAFFKTVGGAAFNFMLPILGGYIAMSIADRPGLVVGFVGAHLANVGVTFANPAGGISCGFLGALIAGFLGGYVMNLLKKVFDKLPDALEGIKPVLLYPVGGVLSIGVIMCAINPFVAMLNTALTNGLNSLGGGSAILLGAVLGGMMSIDMGGPFNKAAYVFGTAAIASGNFDVMAAVMIGGMVPPIAIALATIVFKNKFTENERKSGPVNFIMGLCFITEGAIPFAASDPAKVIPSCVVGSAVAGGLSMAFGCTLRAPHGGIFVFPVVGNPFMYIVALVVGSVVGMLLLGLLKKEVK
ncbi:MAG: fructose-specific PTS transporter subunit EIIC [Candidatus Fimousia sp.]|uniref:PTS fructose transporter subunit IIABC n=1 Tax=Anaerostipes sp. 992a TaxID=1261637 RepID=UPI0009513E5D|nr:fructose-specific PTS transporter subunit EIIC [Anaerostipes sp. 992a]OLR62848.1 PTS fructose transporter subunit IIC [Anaerostipes sp. 992a]